MRKIRNIDTGQALWLIVIVVFLLATCGCSAQNRLNRLLTKNPHLVERTDTAIVYDTTYTAEYKHDTLFRTVQGKRDTFVVNIPGGGNTTIYTSADKSEIEAETYLPADTTISETRIISQIVDTFEAKAKKWAKWATIGAILLMLIIILFVSLALYIYSLKKQLTR